MNNIINYYFNLTANFITLLSFLKYCNSTFTEKKSHNIYFRNLFIYVLLTLITTISPSPLDVILAITINWLFIYATYQSKVKAITKHVIYFNLLYYSLFMIIFGTLTFFTYVVLDIQNDFFENIKTLVIATGIYIIFVLLFNRKVQKYKNLYNPYKKYIYLLILLIGAVLCFMVVYSLRYTKNTELMQFILLGTLLLNIFMVVLILSVYEKIVDSFQEAALSQMQLQRYELTQSYNDDIAEKSKQLISIRHDFKNHLGVIAGRLESQNYAEALAYLKNITEAIQSAGDLIVTNNTTVSAILQSKKSECERKGITFAYTAAFEKIHKLLDLEITIILGNILDNAIEALETDEIKEKYIILSISQIATYLVIRCENPYVHDLKEKNGYLLTSKKEKEFHGMGLKNVSDVCEKYRGELYYNYDNSLFTIRILLPNY